MPSPRPLCTRANCRPAYQLNGSLSLFWKQQMASAEWLDDLRKATEPDGVRVLQHRFVTPSTSQFLISTKPHVAPHSLVRSVKGRLQHLVRDRFPSAFRRNYSFRSIGSAKREVIEEYIRSQMSRHPMADPRVQQRFARFQIHDPSVDLSRPRHGGHCIYRYNLHVVFINQVRWREIREERLGKIQKMIVGVSRKRGFLLSEAGVVPDHIHLALGCPADKAPDEVALCYMNNLAYACGMQPVFEFGFYVGTFGEYDLGVVS